MEGSIINLCAEPSHNDFSRGLTTCFVISIQKRETPSDPGVGR